MAARFFRNLTSQRQRLGAFRSLSELTETITDYLVQDNAARTPFVWTAAAPDILAGVKRPKRKLNTTR